MSCGIVRVLHRNKILGQDAGKWARVFVGLAGNADEQVKKKAEALLRRIRSETRVAREGCRGILDTTGDANEERGT